MRVPYLTLASIRVRGKATHAHLTLASIRVRGKATHAQLTLASIRTGQPNKPACSQGFKGYRLLSKADGLRRVFCSAPCCVALPSSISSPSSSSSLLHPTRLCSTRLDSNRLCPARPAPPLQRSMALVPSSTCTILLHYLPAAWC